MTARTTVGAQAQPRLAPHVRLRFDERRERWVVLAPERLLLPDEIAMEVLHRCDGRTPIAAMVEGFATTFDASREEIMEDVLALVQELVDRGVLVP